MEKIPEDFLVYKSIANLSAFNATAAFKYFENSGTIQFEADKPGKVLVSDLKFLRLMFMKLT